MPAYVSELFIHHISLYLIEMTGTKLKISKWGLRRLSINIRVSEIQNTCYMSAADSIYNLNNKLKDR